MKFLDKKEQVLELQMTQYGKALMSRGVFQPAYYAFFDDDVVYDSKYMGRIHEDGTEGVVQLENSTRISDRISDAIRPETQYNYAGVESTINNLQRDVVSAAVFDKERELTLDEKLEALSKPPSAIDNYYSLGLPMGTSEHGSSKAPAFNLNFHSGEVTNLNLEDGAQFYTGSSGLLKIPQLEVEVIYDVYIKAANSPQALKKIKDNFEKHGKADIYTFENSLNYIKVEGGEVLVDVGELNSLFEHENFDIEVYEVVEGFGFVGSGVGIQESLKPLYFKKKNPVQDGLYDNSTEQQEPETTNNVGYYFEIMVDEEITEDNVIKSVISTNVSNMSQQDIYETPTNNDKGPC